MEHIPKQPAFWIAAAVLAFFAYTTAYKAGSTQGSVDSA